MSSCCFQANSRVVSLLLLMPLVGLTAPAWAVTEEELQGDYVLTALSIDYNGFPPTIDEDDFSPLTGVFSATGKTLLFEHSGQASSTSTIYQQRTAGPYNLFSDNAARVYRVNDAPPVIVGLRMPSSDSLIVTGSALDSNGDAYDYTYEFSRQETYYTQAQLDDAVEEATDGLFTEKEVEVAVEEALKNVKPKAVVIPLFD